MTKFHAIEANAWVPCCAPLVSAASSDCVVDAPRAEEDARPFKDAILPVVEIIAPLDLSSTIVARTPAFFDSRPNDSCSCSGLLEMLCQS